MSGNVQQAIARFESQKEAVRINFFQGVKKFMELGTVTDNLDTIHPLVQKRQTMLFDRVDLNQDPAFLTKLYETLSNQHLTLDTYDPTAEDMRAFISDDEDESQQDYTISISKISQNLTSPARLDGKGGFGLSKAIFTNRDVTYLISIDAALADLKDRILTPAFKELQACAVDLDGTSADYHALLDCVDTFYFGIRHSLILMFALLVFKQNNPDPLNTEQQKNFEADAMGVLYEANKNNGLTSLESVDSGSLQEFYDSCHQTALAEQQRHIDQAINAAALTLPDNLRGNFIYVAHEFFKGRCAQMRTREGKWIESAEQATAELALSLTVSTPTLASQELG
jgi:hypothetical protein